MRRQKERKPYSRRRHSKSRALGQEELKRRLLTRESPRPEGKGQIIKSLEVIVRIRVITPINKTP